MNKSHINLAEFAARKIKQHGREVKFQRLSAGTGTASTPWKGNAGQQIVEEEISAFATFIPSQGLKLGNEFFDEELLKRFTMVCMAEATNGDLSKMTRILDTDGTYWKLNNGQEAKPGEITMMYAFGLTR